MVVMVVVPVVAVFVSVPMIAVSTNITISKQKV